MKKLLRKLTALKNTSGQDFLEYALIAGLLAMTAGAIMPGVASRISTIFSQVASVMPVDPTQVASAATN